LAAQMKWKGLFQSVSQLSVTVAGRHVLVLAEWKVWESMLIMRKRERKGLDVTERLKFAIVKEKSERHRN